MENDYCVYIHTAPNGKKYVGITKQKLERRWLYGFGYKQNSHFFNAIQKYGWENFDHEVVARNLDRESAGEMEKSLIAEHRTLNPEYGYNKTYGGEFGSKHTDVTRQVISEKVKEKWLDEDYRTRVIDGHLGRHHSEETRRKMSESHLANPMSEEHKEKLRQMMRERKYAPGTHHWCGRVVPKETRRKISESKKGKHYGGTGRVPRKVMCVDTQVVYESVAVAAADVGVSGSSIYRVCNDERSKAKGYRWQFVT